MTIADDFKQSLRSRLQLGANEGNRSLGRPPRDIAAELCEELVDQVGWLYPLWFQSVRAAGSKEAERHLRAQFIGNVVQLSAGVRGDRSGVPLVAEIERLGARLMRDAHDVWRVVREIVGHLEADRSATMGAGSDGTEGANSVG